jgi:hypothetical protein
MKRTLYFSALLVVAACFDKVHSDEVAALGPEDPNIAEGPRHRAGQNCTTCHGPVLTESPEISVGGTVYLNAEGKQPAVSATVTIIDKNGVPHDLGTNDVGNFHARKSEYDPPFPWHVKVTFVDGNGTSHLKEMTTLVRRDGGCGRCHDGTDKNGDADHARHVFATDATSAVKGGGP